MSDTSIGSSWTVERAHEAMREHVGCRAAHCPVKGQAFRVLVAEGHLVPDPDRTEV